MWPERLLQVAQSIMGTMDNTVSLTGFRGPLSGVSLLLEEGALGRSRRSRRGEGKAG